MPIPIEKSLKSKLKTARKIIDLWRLKEVLSTGNGIGKPTQGLSGGFICVHIEVLVLYWFLREAFVESTSPRSFRANLKEYMEMAADKPIRIQRREGNACVLMSEEYYEGLLNEISSLQKSLLSANQALKGDVIQYKMGDKDRLHRIKK